MLEAEGVHCTALNIVGRKLSLVSYQISLIPVTVHLHTGKHKVYACVLLWPVVEYCNLRLYTSQAEACEW